MVSKHQTTKEFRGLKDDISKRYIQGIDLPVL